MNGKKKCSQKNFAKRHQGNEDRKEIELVVNVTDGQTLAQHRRGTLMQLKHDCAEWSVSVTMMIHKCAQRARFIAQTISISQPIVRFRNERNRNSCPHLFVQIKIRFELNGVSALFSNLFII